MKKYLILFAALALTACSDDPKPQVQYQQPAPVIVQQAPVQQAPVIVQQDNSGAAMAAGAALGAVTAMALSDRDRHYQQAPQPVQNTTIIHKTKIIERTVQAPAAPAVAGAPVTPTAAPVNLTKTAPSNFAAPGTQSPVPTMSAAALTAPKAITMPTATPGKTLNYGPANVAHIGVSKPAALPPPKPSFPALPAPTKVSLTKLPVPAPAKVSYSSTPRLSYTPSKSSYSAPKTSSSSYSYKPSKK